MERKVRVRFAPSPTGPLHIGGVRTALYNYLFAKKNNGDFILRIEDTDQTRFVPGAEKYIIESLEWCGIKFDEGVHIGGTHAPYRQSERKNLYKQYAEQLIQNGNAYYAFDTPEELEEMRKKLESIKSDTLQYDSRTRLSMKNSLTLDSEEVNKKLSSGCHYVIRIKTPENEEIQVNDLIRGLVTVNSSKIDDKVLFKSDGMPTYHLANVVDDYLMKVSHVIRGEEWLPSAPLHVLLYRYLGWERDMPQFAHLPLLLKPDGNGKLSKRDGDRLGFPVFPLRWEDPTSKEISSGYRESGYFPEAFINIIALLGWNSGTNQEIFSMNELIDTFSIDRVVKSGSKFDPEKAKWFNQQYLKAKNDSELAKELQILLKENNINCNDEYVRKICFLMKERVHFLKEIIEQGSFFFNKPTSYDMASLKKKWKDNTGELLKILSERFEKISDFSAENVEASFKEFLKEKNIQLGDIMLPLRIVITGLSYGPSLFEIISLIGKTETLNRINNFKL